MKQPLHIYVIWHPEFIEGKIYAELLYSALTREVENPLSRGIGIPVYYRYKETKNGIPEIIDFNDSEHTVIITLIDEELILDDGNWKNYINELFVNIQLMGKKHLFLPVAFLKSAFDYTSVMGAKNFIRLFDAKGNERTVCFIENILQELCRLLYMPSDFNQGKAPPPLKLFISHAKADGESIAKSVHDYLVTSKSIKTFFDSIDIGYGYDFAKEIEANIKEATLLIVQTDMYAIREWCQKEVLLAKEHSRPIILLSCYEHGEERSFPYMYNVPVVKVNKNDDQNTFLQDLVLKILKETLRFKYQQLYIHYVCNRWNINADTIEIFSRPPELISFCFQNKLKTSHAIYPDPPLGEQETDILQSFKETGEFLTPVLLPFVVLRKIHEKNNIKKPLKDMTISISISESQDIGYYGFSINHLQDVLVETTRYLLSSGATLAYGGDVTYQVKLNFLTILFELLKQYMADYSGEKPDRIINYCSYPLYELYNKTKKAELAKVAQFIPVQPPEELKGNAEDIVRLATTENHYKFARSLTIMREQMTKSCDAYIQLGGKITGYKGKYPGVVEEAYICLKTGKPLFLIGSFGGCVKVIIDTLEGEKPEELTGEFHLKNEKYKKLYEFYINNTRETDQINYTKLVEFFNKKGINSLNNGLTEEENRVLFCKADPLEIIPLILKGLWRIRENKGG